VTDRILLVLLLLGSIGLAGTLVRALAQRHYQRVRRLTRLPATAPLPRILAFSGPGCSACAVQKRILEQVVSEMDGRIQIEHFDATVAPDLARQFGVLVVPTTVVAAPDGRIVAINGGLTDRDRLREQIVNAA
jgi:thiol-disulfide isomerase/thioredoxin